MINRKEYLNRLAAWRDKDVIKVITGIRRCGKSKLLELYRDYLRSAGVPDSQIISVELEDINNAHLLDKTKLHDYILSHLTPGKKLYVFLDEIQNVPEFEKCVDSLYLRKDLDIYITGSNAYFLSGELATFLSGRYIAIDMLPLSFAEYVDWTGDKKDLMRKYNDYAMFGAFPYVTELNNNAGIIDDYLRGIFHTIVLKDVCDRYKFVDTMQLQSILKYCYSNIANITSATSVANAMTSSGRKIDAKTVEKYLSAFTQSYLLYQAGRYDIKGKQHLKLNAKFYAADSGLRYMLLGRKNPDTGYVLENIVFLELKRRGYDVYTGKIDGGREVDFVAINPNDTVYFQVAASVLNENTLNRELSALRAIPDNYPKIILTLDETAYGDYDGIRIVRVLDWLLDK